jgi:heme-degrading monooxygenase HmoA
MDTGKTAAAATGDVVAIASHRVADYATWRAVYDAGKDLRRRGGVTGAEVFVDPGDPNAVVVITRFDSLAAMQAFASNAELAEAMKQGGVIMPRSLTVGVKP